MTIAHKYLIWLLSSWLNLLFLKEFGPRSDWDWIGFTGGEVTSSSFCLWKYFVYRNILDIDNCTQIPDVTKLLFLKENSHRSSVVRLEVIHPGGFPCDGLLILIIRVFLSWSFLWPQLDIADIQHLDDGHPDRRGQGRSSLCLRRWLDPILFFFVFWFLYFNVNQVRYL